MIDWDRFKELREEIGAEDLDEVVAVFLEETDEVMGRIRKLPASQMEAQLHFLKGSALNLGLSEFAELCQQGEKRAASGVSPPVDLDALAALYDASRARFLLALQQSAA